MTGVPRRIFGGDLVAPPIQLISFSSSKFKIFFISIQKKKFFFFLFFFLLFWVSIPLHSPSHSGGEASSTHARVFSELVGRWFGSGDLDLHEHGGVGELGLDAGAGGRVLLVNPGGPDLVHVVKEAHVGEPNHGGQDVGLVGAALGQQLVDLVKNLLRLGLQVAGGITNLRGKKKKTRTIHFFESTLGPSQKPSSIFPPKIINFFQDPSKNDQHPPKNSPLQHTFHSIKWLDDVNILLSQGAVVAARCRPCLGHQRSVLQMAILEFLFINIPGVTVVSSDVAGSQLVPWQGLGSCHMQPTNPY